jgi:hypothetical protein
MGTTTVHMTTAVTIRPATVPLVTAARLAGVGRNSAYKAAAAGQLADGIPVIQVNGTYRVPVTALERVLGINVAEWLAGTNPDND